MKGCDAILEKQGEEINQLYSICCVKFSHSEKCGVLCNISITEAILLKTKKCKRTNVTTRIPVIMFILFFSPHTMFEKYSIFL